MCFESTSPFCCLSTLYAMFYYNVHHVALRLLGNIFVFIETKGLKEPLPSLLCQCRFRGFLLGHLKKVHVVWFFLKKSRTFVPYEVQNTLRTILKEF